MSLFAAPSSGLGAASRRAWKMLSNVKLVMRIEGMRSECASRQGRAGASERTARMWWVLRKCVSSLVARAGEKVCSECSDCGPESW